MEGDEERWREMREGGELNRWNAGNVVRDVQMERDGEKWREEERLRETWRDGERERRRAPHKDPHLDKQH